MLHIVPLTCTYYRLGLGFACNYALLTAIVCICITRTINSVNFFSPNFYAFLLFLTVIFFFSLSLKHLEEKAKATCEALNGPLEDAATMDDAK